MSKRCRHCSAAVQPDALRYLCACNSTFCAACYEQCGGICEVCGDALTGVGQRLLYRLQTGICTYLSS